MRPLHWLYARLSGLPTRRCQRCSREFYSDQMIPAEWIWDDELNCKIEVYPQGIRYRVDRRKGGPSGRIVYCPRCAKTRDEWEPGWRTTVASPLADWTRAEGRDLAR